MIPFIIYGGIYLYAAVQPKLPIGGANGYYFYDSEGKAYDTGATEDWVSLDDISDYLIEATIDTEDKHFYSHQGFDFLRIIKALMINISSGENKQGLQLLLSSILKIYF